MTATPRSPLPRIRPRLVLGVVGFWLLVGLVAEIQGILSARLEGQALFALGDPLEASAVWVVLTLGTVWLAARVPLRGPGWPGALGLHLAASGAVTFLLDAGIRILEHVLGTGPGFTGVDAYLASSIRWLHINALVYWVIVGLAHGVALLRERQADAVRRAELEAQLARAELRTLRAQLHPHFLFNALHTVGLLWRTGRSEEAQETMEGLGSLLRQVTDPGRAQETTLYEELELVREYLAIEGVRFGDRLRVEEAVPDDVLDAWVPCLVLQPLVENAVRHGVEGRSGAATVRIEAERTLDGLLEIRVLDDGPGPREPRSQGIGLSNTRERLSLLYGDDWQMDQTRSW